MPIASALISSLVVDQNLVATTDDEPIEDVDPIDAMKDEMTSMSQNKVWSLVDLLNGCKPIGCK